MADLAKLRNHIAALRTEASPANLSYIKAEINALYQGAECLDVLYTLNTDKLFFGLMVIPSIDADKVNTILLSDDDVKIDKYYMEIDSKLFDRLEDEEICIMIDNDVSNLINSGPVIMLRRIIDTYFQQNATTLSIKDSIQYRQILTLGMVDTIYKSISLIYSDDDLMSTNLDMEAYGRLEEIKDKALNILPGCVSTSHPKLIILEWCMRLYRDVQHKRISAIHTLQKLIDISGSALMKREMSNVLRALDRIDTDLVTESAIQEATKKNSIFSQIKYNGLRGIEDDFYEYMVRARNAETEEEVMYALKQINLRLALLDDYINKEDMPDAERQRWTELYMKYRGIRDVIAKKKVYNKKNYGLFFDYNQLDSLDNMD